MAFQKYDQETRVAAQDPAFQETKVIQSAAVIEIAKEFNCPCGKCDHRLDSCSCDHPKGTLEIKNFIAQQLRQGHISLTSWKWSKTNMAV